MAEQLLHDAEIGAAGERVCRATVAEPVGVEVVIFAAESGDDLVHALAGDLSSLLERNKDRCWPLPVLAS